MLPLCSRSVSRVLSVVSLLIFMLTACGMQGAQSEERGKLEVVATTSHLGDVVRQIAGDSVSLATLLGPGIDPHTYVATEGDLRTFQRADLIIAHGRDLEAQLARVLNQIGDRGSTMVIAVADRLDPAQLLSWEPERNMPFDPHVWNDVQLWKQVVILVRDVLIAADAANTETYQRRSETYLAELEALDRELRTAVAQIPPERRIIVTAHDAFGYLGRAYGFEVEAVQGISTEAEASTADIQALTRLVIERRVPAIFVETTISPRTIEAVQAAVRAAGREVALGGELYSDALGELDSPTGTYVGMMRHNITTIVTALGG